MLVSRRCESSRSARRQLNCLDAFHSQLGSNSAAAAASLQRTLRAKSKSGAPRRWREKQALALRVFRYYLRGPPSLVEARQKEAEAAGASFVRESRSALRRVSTSSGCARFVTRGVCLSCGIVRGGPTRSAHLRRRRRPVGIARWRASAAHARAAAAESGLGVRVTATARLRQQQQRRATATDWRKREI